MNRARWTKAFAAAALGFALTACEGGGTSLAGDQEIASTCPASGCADDSVDKSQLSITYTGASPAYVSPPKDSNGRYLKDTDGGHIDPIEFGGDCFPSTYPNNRIEVSLYNNGGSKIGLGGNHVAPTDTNAVPTGTYPRDWVKCRQGRYGFSIYGGKLPAGGSYRVEAEIIGIDADGNEFRSSGAGKFSVVVTR